MANDISGINSNRPQLSSNRSGATTTQNEAAGYSANESSTNNSDRVSLTSTASKLKSIEQQLASSSPIDRSRVQAVQTALANGEYNVDAGRIADKLMSFENFMNK